MAEDSDMRLLAEYVSHNSEEAFATLVRRHVNLVYSAAYRQVGDFHKAQEVTQVVFIILAQKAARLKQETILAGWLYQTARLSSASFRRAERRRCHHEHNAFMQASLNDLQAGPGWEQLAPLLDEAMGRLGETERNAIVLRYFEAKPIGEVARALGLEEWAVRKRLDRAVEKLRIFFARRGVAVSALVLCATLSTNAAQAAPPAVLAAAATAAALKGTAVASSTATLLKGTLKLMTWTKIKSAAVIGVTTLAIGGAVALSRPSPSGLVNSWSGENNAMDSLGKNNGTLSAGVTFVPGKVGRAWQFNGVDGTINFGASAGNFGTADFTIDYWMKTSSSKSGESFLEQRVTCDGNHSFWEIHLGGGVNGLPPAGYPFLSMANGGGAAPSSLFCTRALNDGLWHHLAWVRKGADRSLYVDGFLDNHLNDGRVHHLANGQPLVMGTSVCAGVDGTSLYSGAADELDIWNRALSAEEIAAICQAGNAGKHPGGKPVVTLAGLENKLLWILGSAVVLLGAFGIILIVWRGRNSRAP